MTSRAELERLVRERAGDRCEYCRVHQLLQGASFHLEHVTPSSRGGPTELDNLAWARPGCNLGKADRVDALDPLSGHPAPLFNPRRDAWADHFRWVGHRIEPLTPAGRATIAALDLNRPRRILIRQSEQLFALFPPRS